MADRAREKIESYSGGMKRRINIGAALMHHPQLLIMDEPTVDIDPQSRNHILETVRQLNRDGMTVIYTIHYIEEVDYLCDRIAIIDHGEVIALGTKQEFCSRLAGGTSIRLTVDRMSERLVKRLQAVQGVGNVSAADGQIAIFAANVCEVLGDVVTTAIGEGVRIVSLDVRERKRCFCS